MLTAQPQTGTPGSVAGTRPIAVEVRDVSKRYGARKEAGADQKQGVGRQWALKDISFDVERGEMLGLLGPNGAGKTTLLKSMATLLEVTSGRIVVEGIAVADEPLRARRMLGLVTCDERSFYWRLSGRQNLQFFGALYDVPKTELHGRIERLLDALQLTEAGDRPYHSYSTGMRQKMAVARGLLTNPRLILYDEPTRSLDPVSTQRIREWIRASRRNDTGQTHIIATNQLAEAEQLCDRVLIVNGGRIVAQGTVAELRAKFGDGEQLAHRIVCRGIADGCVTAPDGEAGVWEVSNQPGEDGTTVVSIVSSADGRGLSMVLEAILRTGGQVLRCETETASFEEIFCRIIQGSDGGGQTGRGQ